jgi:hypothetical protein
MMNSEKGNLGYCEVSKGNTRFCTIRFILHCLRIQQKTTIPHVYAMNFYIKSTSRTAREFYLLTENNQFRSSQLTPSVGTRSNFKNWNDMSGLDINIGVNNDEIVFLMKGEQKTHKDTDNFLLSRRT